MSQNLVSHPSSLVKLRQILGLVEENAVEMPITNGLSLDFFPLDVNCYFKNLIWYSRLLSTYSFRRSTIYLPSMTVFHPQENKFLRPLPTHPLSEKAVGVWQRENYGSEIHLVLSYIGHLRRCLL